MVSRWTHPGLDFYFFENGIVEWTKELAGAGKSPVINR